MSDGDKMGCGCLTICVLAALWMVGLVVWNFAGEWEVNTISGHIEDSYVKRSGSDSDKFFIAVRSADGNLEVLEDRDAWAQGKFNSADVQQQIRILRESNANVCFTVNGRRVPFFSYYRNVLTARSC
jgi:hypothetical protein